MDIVRLVEYVKEWELFEKIDFDQIVSDFDFSKYGVDWFIKISNYSDLEKVSKNQKTLFILDKLLPENLSDFFDMNNVFILDLNAWVFGYGKKLWISKIDVVNLIDKWFDVFEPLDLFSFLSCFDSSGKKYIRICDLDIPENFVNSKILDIVSLENHGFSDWNMSIVCSWMFLAEVVRLGNLLSEKWLPIKIFVLNKLNFDFVWDLKNENNLIFILDHFNFDWYEKYVKSVLAWKNINFIYPKYENLSTILDDYKLEELEFDVIGFAKAMWNNL